MNREETRIYESVVILRPSLGDPEIQQFAHAYTVRLEHGGSTSIKMDNWGKQKLAYKVKGERKGTYLCFMFQGTGAVIQPLESANRIDDLILKSMTIRVENPSKNTEVVNGAEDSESAVV